MKDFLKKYGLLIIPAYTVMNRILGILQNVGFYFSRIEFLLANLMAALLMALAILLSFKAVNKPCKRSKNQLINACIFAAFSVIAEQIPNIMQGGFHASPITIIAVISVIANAILQKKNIQQKKDSAPATEAHEQAMLNPVEVKAEAVNAASVAPVAVVENNAENLKGKELTVEDFGIVKESVDTDLSKAIIAVVKPAITNQLKAPASAQFQEDLISIVCYGENVYEVSGYVDSQNGYGAMIRNDFAATVEMTNGIPNVKAASVGTKKAKNDAKEFATNYVKTLIFTGIGAVIIYFIINAVVNGSLPDWILFFI